MRRLSTALLGLCAACSAPTPPSVAITSHRMPVNAVHEVVKPSPQVATSQARSSTELPVFRGLDPKTFKGR